MRLRPYQYEVMSFYDRDELLLILRAGVVNQRPMSIVRGGLPTTPGLRRGQVLSHPIPDRKGAP
jgi:hypothetical protein